MSKILRNCEYCAKEFATGNSPSRENRGRFCSKNCYNLWRRQGEGSRHRSRWNSWDEHFFDDLTPDGAYIIGLIIADGYIRNSISGRGTRQYTVGIHQNNPDILHRIAQVLNFEGNLCGAGNSSTMQLMLGSKHAWRMLTGRYGIPAGKAKTYTARIPEIIRSDIGLSPHFIRGYFDGDGSIYIGNSGGPNGYCRCNQLHFCSGSSQFMNDLVEVLVKYVGMGYKEPIWRKGGYVKKDGTYSGDYEVRWVSLSELVDFAHFIYGPDLDVYDSDLYLRRKKEKFDSLHDIWQGYYDWLYEEYVVNGRSIGNIAKDSDIEAGGIGIIINMLDLRQERSQYWNLELGI